MKASLM